MPQKHGAHSNHPEGVLQPSIGSVLTLMGARDENFVTESKAVRISEAEVADVIAHEAHVDVTLLSRDSDLAELDIQSLEIVEIIFALEDKFGIEIPYNANSASNKTTGISLQTVGDIVDMVNMLVADQREGVAG